MMYLPSIYMEFGRLSLFSFTAFEDQNWSIMKVNLGRAEFRAQLILLLIVSRVQWWRIAAYQQTAANCFVVCVLWEKRKLNIKCILG